MILDKIEHFSTYINLHPHFQDVQALFNRHALSELPMGRSEINTQGAFVLVSEYQTRDESAGFIESHKQYIDIQLVLAGAERVGIAPVEECTITQEYDAKTDFMKLSGKVVAT